VPKNIGPAMTVPNPGQHVDDDCGAVERQVDSIVRHDPGWNGEECAEGGEGAGALQ
jgi:hypothetical protein